MAVYLGSNEVNLRGGQPMENGLPSGGLTGQVLAKSSNDDYAAAWTTVYDIPAGGSAGQALIKNSSNFGDVSWGDVGLPSGGFEGMILKKNSSTAGDASWDYPTARYVITVTQSGNNYTTTRTWSDISVALSSNKYIGVVLFNERSYYLKYRRSSQETYYFEATYYEEPLTNKVTIVTDEFKFQYINSNVAITRTKRTAYAPPKNLVTDQGKVLKLTGTAVGDFTWADIHEIPTGGTQGQVLKKNSATNYDVSWANESSGGGPFVVTFSDSGNNIVCDKTAVEVHDAADAGTPIIGYYNGVILSCDYEEFIDNWSGYFRGYQYFDNGSVRSISLHLGSSVTDYITYKPLKYYGSFYPSQNEFTLYPDVIDYWGLYQFFDNNRQGECIACVDIDYIIREFSCAQRGNRYDEDLDEQVFFARFTCSEVVENSGVYELHVFSFDSEQYQSNPSAVVVKNYAEKKVVLSAV